ncbi:MAG: hypothetical protein ABIO70_05460 [Pseudomonadota bacterium]
MTARFLLASLLLLSAAALPGDAWADLYYAQTAGIQQHAEADALVEQVQAAGIEAEIVRRFRRGTGWEFIVRTLTTEDGQVAHGYAVRLSELSGQSARVFIVAGHDALPVDELSVLLAGPGGELGAEKAGPARDPEGGDARAERGAELLAAIALAHGGGPVAGASSEDGVDGGWSRAHCRYERRLSTERGELRVGHEFWRDGDALRLDVRILEGTGQDSAAIVRGDEAWLYVRGEIHEVPAGPTREGLLAFAPEVVLGQALAIRAWGAEHPALAVDSPVDGGALVWLEVVPGGESERLLVGADPGDHRVRELIVRSGEEEEARWRFADYQELGDGMIMPLKSEAFTAGEPRERIVVKLIERGDLVDAGVFDPASLKTP